MKDPMMLQHTGGHINAFLIRDNVLMDAIKQDWLDRGGQRFDLAILIIAALNISAAALMVCGIMYDSWLNREWDFFFKTRRRCCNFIPAVHSAEIFSILFAGIAILQGVFYVSISVAKPRDDIYSCKPIAQFVWPVLWIAPYTMLVVGLETVFRSLKSPMFSSQVRWHVSIRVASVLALVIITWVPALVFPVRGQCLVSLIWWTAPFAKVGVGLIFVLIFTFITSASIITFQLLKTNKVDRDRRIEASRIVLYLLFSSFVLMLVLPFYTELTLLRRAIISSKIAMVALNSTGLIPGILYIICRSKADWTMIQASERSWWSRKRAFEIPTSNIECCVYIDSPVSVQSEQSPTLTKDPEKSTIFPPIRKPLAKAIKAEHADRPIPPPPPMAEVPPPSKVSLTHQSNISKSRVRYSLFPIPPPLSSLHRDSVSTTFSEETIEAPKPLFADQRDLNRQSNATSATVEIGLRLSYPGRALDPIEQSPIVKALDSPFRSPPPLQGSFSPPRITANSPFLSPPPLYASQCSNRSTPDPNSLLCLKPAPHMSPPPIRTMKPSRKIDVMKKSTRSDISILPTQPNDARSPGQSPLSPRSILLSPGWIFRTDNFVRSPGRPQGLGQATNKSLPPVPPGEAHRPASRWSPGTLKPRGISWSREIVTRQDWIKDSQRGQKNYYLKPI